MPAVFASRVNPGLGADVADGEDQLQLDSEVDTLCRIVGDTEVSPPLSIGLLGDWGSGKSFFMKEMRAKMRLLLGGAPDNGMCGSDAQIEFNALNSPTGRSGRAW